MTAISAASATESAETANPFPDLPAIRGPELSQKPAGPVGPVPRRVSSPRFGDYSRTRFESRVAIGGADADEDAEGELSLATPTRQFSVLEITSGIPDDSREADERAAERRVHDLRGRVKASRAAISKTPGAEEVLRRDWMKAARFYARFGVTEDMFRRGVSPLCLEGEPGQPRDSPGRPVELGPTRDVGELHNRARAVG